MNMVERHMMKLPISSKRKPSHSLDPLLWKSMRKFLSTRWTFSCVNPICFLKQRIVVTPEMLSEKWWITGAFVIESRRVISRDDAIKYPCKLKKQKFWWWVLLYVSSLQDSNRTSGKPRKLLVPGTKHSANQVELIGISLARHIDKWWWWYWAAWCTWQGLRP